MRRTRPRPHWLSQKAFTLIEVLISLGLAALVLGVLLRSVATELAGVARLTPRFQNLLLASYELEAALGERTPGEETRDFYPYPREPGDGDPWKVQISSEVTTADPRLEAVTLVLTPSNAMPVTVSAYRLRARRQDEPPVGGPSPSPRPGASPRPGGSPRPSGTGSTSGGLSGGTTGGLPGGASGGGLSGGTTVGGSTTGASGGF